MFVKKLAKKVYLLSGSPATIIILGEPTWVVDPGVGEERAGEVLGFLKSKKVGEYEVFATHAHPDHIASAAGLKPIHIHRFELSIAESTMLRNTLVFGAKAPSGVFSLSSPDVRVKHAVE